MESDEGIVSDQSNEFEDKKRIKVFVPSITHFLRALLLEYKVRDLYRVPNDRRRYWH